MPRAVTDRRSRVGLAVRAAPGALLLLLAAGCGPEIGSAQYAVAVEDLIDSGCSTAVVIELSRQVADEVACLLPDAFVTFDESERIEFRSAAVLPYLGPQAAADLVAASEAGEGVLTVTSAYRTLVQQYLLYRWWELGRCGITAAATPGRSNHESGRAIDVANYADWKSVLELRGWEQTVPGDPVHFDHLASADLRGTDVLAFQRLWNRNHSDDLIAEDGIWGPQTEARIEVSPAEGFVDGPCRSGPVDLPPIELPPIEADHHPTGQDAVDEGGCNLGGGAAGLALIALLLLGLRPTRAVC